MNQKEYELIAHVIRSRKEFNLGAENDEAYNEVDELQWLMSYELANTYSNFDGKKFEELCKP